MTRRARFVVASIAVIATVAALAAPSPAEGDAPKLVNASFEDAGDMPAGWEAADGAGRPGKASEFTVDRGVASEGKASLRLSGDASTSDWRLVRQETAARAGDWVRVTAAAKARGIRREAGQFQNANATLEFVDAAGKRLGLLGTTPIDGDAEWFPIVVQGMAPAGTAKVRAGFLLSMSGTMWIDDVVVDVSPTEAETAAGRAIVFNRFAGHLRRTYPFFGIAGRPTVNDWIGRHRDPCVAAPDAKAFVEAVRTMLSELKDVHVNVETSNGMVVGTAEPLVPQRNWNLDAISTALHGSPLRTNRRGLFDPRQLTGLIGEGEAAIGYVWIASWQLDAAKFETLSKSIDELSGAKALIFDVRANGGGDEAWAAKLAGRFAGKDVVFGRFRVRDPKRPDAVDAFQPPVDRILRPLPGAKPDTRRVVVLQSRWCVSSNEAFVQMMAALPNVTTVGLPTRGASANPAPFEILPGVKVTVPRWQTLDLEGNVLEGRGTPPDVRVDDDADAYRDRDPTLERALEILRK